MFLLTFTKITQDVAEQKGRKTVSGMKQGERRRNSKPAVSIFFQILTKNQRCQKEKPRSRRGFLA
jgi:hypothetical protein